MSTSRLLALPRELRDIIYEYAFIGVPKVYLHENTHEAHNSGLLGACKQMRAEALPLYYGHTVFYWSKHFDFHDMRRLVPKTIVKALRTLRLEACTDSCNLDNMKLIWRCNSAALGLGLKEGVLERRHWTLEDEQDCPKMVWCSLEGFEDEDYKCTCHFEELLSRTA